MRIMISESHRASRRNELHSLVIFPRSTKGIVERKRSRSKTGSLITKLPKITPRTQIILQTG